MGESRGEAEERIALELALAETIDAETAIDAEVPAALGTESTTIVVLWTLSGELACSIPLERQIQVPAFKLLVRDATEVPVEEQILHGPSGADLQGYMPTERGTAQTVFLVRDPMAEIPEVDRPHVERRNDCWFCVLCQKYYTEQHAETRSHHIRRLRFTEMQTE